MKIRVMFSNLLLISLTIGPAKSFAAVTRDQLDAIANAAGNAGWMTGLALSARLRQESIEDVESKKQKAQDAREALAERMREVEISEGKNGCYWEISASVAEIQSVNLLGRLSTVKFGAAPTEEEKFLNSATEAAVGKLSLSMESAARKCKAR